ncbi:MAG TPA: hypothetical protein VGL91_23130 [Acidobacteriota bacterium]|jgi:hypothetical protein
MTAGEFFQRDAGQLFGFGSLQSKPVVGSIQIEASGPGVVGDVIFGDAGSFRYAAAMALQNRKFTKAVFSQVANASSFFTGIALYNPNSQPADVTVEVFSDLAVLTGQANLMLAAGSRISRLLAELAPSTANQSRGYVVVRSTQPLVAQQLFGDPGLNFLSAVPPSIVESAP